MFTYLNKVFKTSRRAMSRESGQVAVILILVVAAALIFYAVSLNLGRISQTKVMTTIAADTAASTLASYMASYGQSVFMTSLGGKRKVCSWTGVLVSIIVVIIAIIVLILTWGTAGPAVLAVVSLVLAMGALAMQIMVIQPGLTSAWNDIIWHSMEMKDAFVEQGVQTALSGAATDRVLVPDLDDSDGDRIWGFDGGGQPLDEVSRFGVYYTQRRLNTIPISVAGSVDDFLDDLRDFLTEDIDTWGLIDDTGPVCDPFSANSECNPCCIPSDYWTEEMGCAANVCIPSEFVSCGYTPDPDTVNDVRTPQCRNNSPYGVNYPWVYDAYRGNPVNAFVSLQEQLGRDDEHKEFRKNPVDNLLTPVYDGPNGIQSPLPGDGFKLEDTTSFHAADDRTGVFEFFYKIADWGVNLDPMTLVTNDPLNPQCNWCDLRGGTTCDLALQPAEIPQLELPADAFNVFLGKNTPGGAEFNTTYCVDGEDPNPDPGWPPLGVDLVRLPDPEDVVIPWAPGIGKIEATPEPQCSQDADATVTGRKIGFWKRGGDRFCSAGGDAWPYWGDCPKYGSCPEVIDIDPETGIEEIVDPGCACGDPRAMSAENWSDDLLDDLVYGLNFFADWAQEILRSGETPEGADQLAKEFKNWYPEAAEWIEPGQSNVPRPVNDPACTAKSCCFVCAAEDGALHKWHKAILEMKDRLQAWRDTSFAGTRCRHVWCVPPDLRAESPPYSSCTASFPTPPPFAEEATFNVNGNAVRGDMEDVVACINWNANDTVTYALPAGDAAKFQACKNACAPCTFACWRGGYGEGIYDACHDLPPSPPYSLYPDYDSSSFQTIYNCLTSCSNSSCQAMNPVYFSPGDPSLVDFEADPSLCQPGSDWFNQMDQVLGIPCRSSTVYAQNLDLIISSGGPTATGNAEKFQVCFDECDNGVLDVVKKCADLPRSLVPDVDTRLPDQSELARLQGCLNSCNNANCQAMSPAYFVGNPATTNFQATQCGTWGAGNIWYDEIVAALGDVCDPAPGGWLDGIWRSIPEAQNQVAKFRQRYNYLSGRLNELNGIITVLDEAEQKFNGFLTCADGLDADTDPDGAACRLIKARIDLDRKETGLPYHAIYGWQDEPERGQPADSGRWHIVRADARIPEKCDLACGESQLVNSDPGWPYVKTYTKGWGTKRCYELRGTTGVVKARVTRFDETGRFSTLLFPNAVEIWKPTFERGDRPLIADPRELGTRCLSSMIPNPDETDAYLGSYYYGAFILNKRVDNAAYLLCLSDCLGNPACEAACTPGNAACWGLANRLLASGVTSEACAQYYYHGGTPKGMDFKFVPCQDF